MKTETTKQIDIATPCTGTLDSKYSIIDVTAAAPHTKRHRVLKNIKDSPGYYISSAHIAALLQVPGATGLRIYPAAIEGEDDLDIVIVVPAVCVNGKSIDVFKYQASLNNSQQLSTINTVAMVRPCPPPTVPPCQQPNQLNS